MSPSPVSTTKVNSRNLRQSKVLGKYLPDQIKDGLTDVYDQIPRDYRVPVYADRPELD